MSAHGRFETVAGRPAVRFVRRLDHPVEAVWRAVTDPAELKHWFPGPPPAAGDIRVSDPPRRLAFDWGADRLEIDLQPDGDGCRLTLTHVLSTREQAARDAAGWHVCLDQLEERLGGGAPEAPGATPTPEWRGHYEAYAARGLPTGAPVPS
jgi:uncharacterized protein YndB with AHSA1/START domain